MTYFSSSDAEMFSKLYRTFTSSRFPRDRIQNVAAVKRDGRCTRSKTFHQGAATPTQQQPKFVNCASRRSLKCSVGLLFLQRQFMRNLCLVQTKSNKDSPQSNNTDSASLKLEQTQGGLSAILSGFKGYPPTVDVNQNVPYQNAHTRFKNLCNSRHYHSTALTTNPVFSLLQLPGSNSFTRSTNNNVNVITADVEASTSYRRHDVPVRCYSTSPETEPKPPEGARDETQERPEKIPLKAGGKHLTRAFKFFSFCRTVVMAYLHCRMRISIPVPTLNHQMATLYYVELFILHGVGFTLPCQLLSTGMAIGFTAGIGIGICECKQVTIYSNACAHN